MPTTALLDGRSAVPRPQQTGYPFRNAKQQRDWLHSACIEPSKGLGRIKTAPANLKLSGQQEYQVSCDPKTLSPVLSHQKAALRSSSATTLCIFESAKDRSSRMLMWKSVSPWGPLGAKTKTREPCLVLTCQHGDTLSNKSPVPAALRPKCQHKGY